MYLQLRSSRGAVDSCAYARGRTRGEHELPLQGPSEDDLASPMRTTTSCLRALVLVLASIASGSAVLAQSSVPDLTHGGTKDATHDWNLGPTGARGWICGKNLETSDARQILVTQVEQGSPADGVLQVGDVILGVGAKSFAGDARKLFGAAITEAEKTETHGLLQLQLWRKGANQRATVHQCVEHYHRERNHQGFDNELIEGRPSVGLGDVRSLDRLGGMLRYYHRAA